jgi:pectate lyase
MKISKVLAAYGDGVTIQLSTNVWVDHCDFSGDETVGKDTYDGLVDLSHAADFVTISNNYFHNHVSTFLLPCPIRCYQAPTKLYHQEHFH